MFKISTTKHNSPLICLSAEGRLDTLTSDIFRERLEKIDKDDRFLVVDFSKCNYISSSGVRVLIQASRKMSANSGALCLTSLSVEVFQVLEMAGLDKVLTIYSDNETATDEISKLIENQNRSVEIEICHTKFDVFRHSEATEALSWNREQVAGYNELMVAAGWGTPAECQVSEKDGRCLFVTLEHCTAFIPEDKLESPEFRVVKESSSGAVNVRRAISFNSDFTLFVAPKSTVTIPFQEYLKGILNHDIPLTGSKVRAFIITGQSLGKPSLQLVFHIFSAEKGDLGLSGTFFGARFILNKLKEKHPDESLRQYLTRLLKLENVEETGRLDYEITLDNPVTWVFDAVSIKDAAHAIVTVECEGELTLESYKQFLVRRLYDDSARVTVKQLHGGYSAQTFQVDSYDNLGRRLRPTVLKIAGREMIIREADCCNRYSLPYIMNNSAMVLGTAIFCQTGALRYNFVGIGGENTQLKWLTHYFNSWSTKELKPLFDKIFLDILKPWYGQPVREKIYPFRDHDPTATFFADLVKTAEDVLGINTQEEYISFTGIAGALTNPYHFLKHVYKKRADYGIDYYTSVCHGDLNMQNILLDNQMNVYLIDFSETRPRSVVSDFARLEAIFMAESTPLNSEEDLIGIAPFIEQFYSCENLDSIPGSSLYKGSSKVMERNIQLTLKMRDYAARAVRGERSIVPYYLALLEWVLPIVCYGSADTLHKRLSCYIAGLLCQKIKELTQ